MEIETGSSTYSNVLQVTAISRNGQEYTIGKNTLRENTLEVFIDDVHTMCITCTPTYLKELVIGRLHSEGYISTTECIRAIEFSENLCLVNIALDRKVDPDEVRLLEIVPTTGESIRTRGRHLYPDESFVAYDPTPWNADAIFDLYENFALDTPLHSLTKGTHSCRLAIDGAIVFISEDIGRHNALDKAIGYALMHSVDITHTMFFVSGRIPVDMVSKAIRARIPILVSKAAPTDQAVMLAQKYGLVLICLANGSQIQVFSGVEFKKNSSTKQRIPCSAIR